MTQTSLHCLKMSEARSWPLGAVARDGGVQWAVWAPDATRVECCIFDDAGQNELARYEMHGPHDGIYHGFLPGAKPGMVYGYRAHGPYQAQNGHLFNAHKLLLDPYAREILGRFHWDSIHHGYQIGHADGIHSFESSDNGAAMLKARVPPPDEVCRGHLNSPRRAAADLVLYEVHVKGFSQQLPGLPEELRGSFSALAHPVAIKHFKTLGVNTLSLLPVQYHLDEPALAARGAVNYWGYNTLGFFAPDPVLSRFPDDPGAVVSEFRDMVATLHEHGIGVVLDVVYNHSAEGGEAGPTLSFRGLGHAQWYRLVPSDRSRNENWTGCGNTLDVHHPRVTQFILDSLRYWVECMGVDGFRFDLAPILGRGKEQFETHAAFWTALRQDPVLSGVHLIAEPWDAGPQGYQLGKFPGSFLEWNDKFRDTVRRYWLGLGTTRGEFAQRFTASSDVFSQGQRRPSASVNFITAHDGFTLTDLVSYSQKHNQANGEDNRDGRSDEICHAFGQEGPSSDPQVIQTRWQVRKAMLATLLLSQGTPMMCAGDELGNSQGGNNNAYCQDNPVGWIDWPGAEPGLVAWVSQVLSLRRQFALLRHDQWFTSEPNPQGLCLRWYHPDGHAMQEPDWQDGDDRSLSALFISPTLWLWVAFNPAGNDRRFVPPTSINEDLWQVRTLLDSHDTPLPQGSSLSPFHLPAHGIRVISGHCTDGSA